jgi:hypothetical protein
MKKYTKVSEIRKILPKLKQAKGGPAKSGQMIQIRYEAVKPGRSIEPDDSKAAAVDAGLDLRLFTGYLDKVAYTPAPNPQMIMTMLAYERVDSETCEYQYRSMNLNKGRIRFLKIL